MPEKATVYGTNSMIKALLESVADDYKIYPSDTQSTWISDTVSPKDIDDLRNEANNTPSINGWGSGADMLRLRLWDDWIQGKAPYNALRAYSCASGRVVILAAANSNTEQQPPPQHWIRIFRLLSPDKPVRILWFASEEKRIPPPVGEPIGPPHVNGGYAQKCNAQSIVIYRREEATRVLIHELLHASCSDPTIDSVPRLEADTEAWAEVVLCAIASHGDQHKFNKFWAIQADYSVKQAAAARKFYGVNTDSDYAWRYLTGRLDRFKALGLPLPLEAERVQPLKSLRFTAEQLLTQLEKLIDINVKSKLS